MDEFFHASSVAVIGVSNSPNNLGRAMVYNLMEFRYKGCIYLVGPKGGAFLGHKIYPSVRNLPEPVELASILVPAATVPDVLRDCGEMGIRRVVVQSAGFGELGDDRVHLQKEIAGILEQYHMRMIGPNCIGIMNSQNGLAIPFMPFKAEAPPGRVGIISQSGGVGGMMFNALTSEQIGFSKFASIGNKLDVDEVDLIEYLSRDGGTDLIFCYLEGIADGRRLMEVAARCSKPIIAHKSNRGGKGAAIARSHSASLSSDDRVVEAALRQCGIIRTYEQRAAVDTLKAFLLSKLNGNRLAVISRSGGHAVMAADAAEELGFEVPHFPEEITRPVQEHSRAKVIQPHNPLDLGDLFDFGLYRTLIEKALSLEHIDGLLFIHNYQGVFDAAESRRLILSLEEVIAKSEKPVAVCVFTSQSELEHNRRAVRFPIFTDPREAVRALAINRDWHRRKVLPLSDRKPHGIDAQKVRKWWNEQAPGPLAPDMLAAVLSAYGIPLVPWRHAMGLDAALAAAQELGYPVALKTAQPEVVHKSDVGGVFLDLCNADAVKAAGAALASFGPSLLVQKMSESGCEWFAGGRQDRQFGPVVIVGLGGVYVEILRETSIRVGPLSYEEASHLLDENRGSALLAGVRGQPPLDREALIDLVVRVSWLLNDFPGIDQLDLNPIRVFPKGCYALDWRAVKG